MISRNQDDLLRRLTDENQELKDCLRALQREMFDIVDLKTTVYRSRFEAEFKGADFDAVRHDLERVREELFALPFDQAGRELVQRFTRNFQRLREFMEKVDKDLA